MQSMLSQDTKRVARISEKEAARNRFALLVLGGMVVAGCVLAFTGIIHPGVAFLAIVAGWIPATWAIKPIAEKFGWIKRR